MLGLAACSTTAITSTTQTQTMPTDTAAIPSTATTTVGTSTVDEDGELPRTVLMVGDTELRVWVADDAEERTQGLRDVDGLPRDVDGMLFVFDTATPAIFVMEDTLIPLDVWFFDDEGALIGTHEMSPCSAGPCPRYPAPAPVRWALETPLGDQQFQSGDLLSTSASG